VATGIEQTGESPGKLNPPTNVSGNNVNYASMTFGQGISVTMIQMVQAVAAIANGGKLYQPRLIDEITRPGERAQRAEPKLISNTVIKPETANQLNRMMQLVVEHGSGYATQIKGYKVAGKTGTAQIPKPDGTGYDETKNIGSFIGFAPADNPRFVMMVRVNEPKVSGFAESTTVPIFANIAKWLITYMELPPT
jgi:cell division protein FtsI/penicillin-binding protein 2